MGTDFSTSSLGPVTFLFCLFVCLLTAVILVSVKSCLLFLLCISPMTDDV